MSSVADTSSSRGFAQLLTVDQLNIDHLGHVNNVVYLQWAQKLAIDFWEANATPEMIKARLWIARSHNIEYLKPAFLGDILLGLLTFKEFRGVRVLFQVEIHRDNNILARVQSWWCSIDAATHRPSAVAKSFLKQLVSVAAPDA